jgi:fumarylacetoacetate (FAA) hydrolase family protein
MAGGVLQVGHGGHIGLRADSTLDVPEPEVDDELVEYPFRGDDYPDGVVLSTGTCLVPEAPFSLANGDTVTISVQHVGTLTTPVRRVAGG